MLVYRFLWQFMLLDPELSPDAISLSMEEYDHKAMQKIFKTVQINVLNLRGQFKKQLTIYL